MEQRLTELWYRERARVSLLTPLAWLYGALMRARRRAYVSGWVRTERRRITVLEMEPLRRRSM